MVKGAAGVFVAGFVSKFLIENVAPTHFFKKSTASFSLANDLDNSAFNTLFPGKSNRATALKLEIALWLSISFSRSTIKRTATD